MYHLKIYRGVMCHGNEEWFKTWTGINLSVQNWHEVFDKFWPKHSKISKIGTIMGWFWPKYIMFELNKYRVVMFDDTKDWCKIWRKTDLYFLKWHDEFDKFLFSLKNSAFILENKMAEIKIKIQNNQIEQMQCENFILPWKWKESCQVR